MIPAQQIYSRQATEVELITFRCDESEIVGSPTVAQNQAALPEGWAHGTAAKTGTGAYTITLKQPGLRNCVVVGVTPIGTQAVYNSPTPSTSVITLNFVNTAAAATDTDFSVTVAVFRNKAVY